MEGLCVESKGEACRGKKVRHGPFVVKIPGFEQAKATMAW